MKTLDPENDRAEEARGTDFGFEVLFEDVATQARVGRITTPHGIFETPVFMPVGTQGTVKTLTPRDLQEVGSEIILGNAYHLYIRPGIDIIKKFGGLHQFMGWPGPILTDSGGYQVFSLSRLRDITEDGVRFHSYFDGKEVFFTPESVIEVQEAIGSDIAMIFDECPPPTKDRERIRESMELTLRWAKRAKKHHRRKEQALFGIVQGGFFEDLRLESLERTVEIGFDGYALGGLCVGEDKTDTQRILQAVVPKIPAGKPRYLMGIGTPLDFLDAVAVGADMFDCVNPTRYGRNGTAFTAEGLVSVRNAKYSTDSAPVDSSCPCYACANFSRAYLRHLFNAGEMLGPQLLSLHNVGFFVKLVADLRQMIRDGKFESYCREFKKRFDPQKR
ncbi:MAG: tRNA guanosine(34) transglycosylase Tgt [Candidatus Omnitrophota bacterium]|nr:tRNA guanosine(34) transglycosylase Tgt [Candidatus Omnitrophota bacterium]